MPLQVAFHEINALAFDRMRNERGRSTGLPRDRIEGFANQAVIMPIHLSHRPSERPEFIGQRIQRKYVRYCTQTLDFIVVDDSHQVVEAVMGRE